MIVDRNIQLNLLGSVTFNDDLLELDESKEIIECSEELCRNIELLIQKTIRGISFVGRYVFAHDRNIRSLAKIQKISIDKAELLYNAVRYFEIQP